MNCERIVVVNTIMNENVADTICLASILPVAGDNAGKPCNVPENTTRRSFVIW